ncbi:M23 family metallopeptidase [Legionella pneumophila]|uniref:M23 family metallopeptidase n=1 Tax=Legionella pneumophila TaxID=446 RepID=UPI00026D9FAF|nr:M23 family metallopeptidase [Legionella pneumophila]MDW9139737.1 M23 family metallopeptidase [Legionella pneumophila]CCD09769.1 peptidase [Legionella pneumophila subsp. pneumophila]CZJ69869.1 putative peptidase [Legionella pneumophila]CZR08603.1 putative peptidase [Legionella pneumophila]STX66538.1 secreted peptidase [Legionella pneumophila]
MIKSFLVTIFLFLVSGLILARDMHAFPSRLESNQDKLVYFQLEAETFYSPKPVTIEGQFYLTYEVFLANVGDYLFSLENVEVLNGRKPYKVLFSYNQEELRKMIYSFSGHSNHLTSDLTLRLGERGLLFFMVKFDSLDEIPEKIMHRFHLYSSKTKISEEGARYSFLAAPAYVKITKPLVIANPLDGKHWMAINGPSNHSIHRRARVAAHGIVYYPERYAIDFMQFGVDGHVYKENPNKNENYYSYGANVYSVADGEVVAVYDGVPDNTPSGRDYPVTLSNMAGNHVIIKIGKHQYALYAHLIPHSIKVTKGELVRKNQLIAKLGNSGNSDAPHLHFHVIDKPSPLIGQGIPYAFEHFSTEEYRFAGDEWESPIVYEGRLTEHHHELVHENALMNFEEK